MVLTPAGHRKRVKRLDHPGVPRFLTFSCYQRQPFFNYDFTREWFISSLSRARDRLQFSLWAFVIMPEHVHLIVFPGVHGVSEILTAVKLPVARQAVAWAKQDRPDFLKQMSEQKNGEPSYRFWQRGGGFDRDLRSKDDLLQKMTYVHGNPVKRGLVARPEEWPWSSYRAWEDSVDEPIKIDRENFPR